MPPFSVLLADDVKTTLRAFFNKVKTQAFNFNHRNEVVESYNFCLVDEDAAFRIILVLAPIRNQFHINFTVGYMLCEDSEIRYFYPTMENVSLFKTTFRFSQEGDIETFCDEFERGQGLAICYGGGGAVVSCICSIDFLFTLLKMFFNMLAQPQVISQLILKKPIHFLLLLVLSTVSITIIYIFYRMSFVLVQ